VVLEHMVATAVILSRFSSIEGRVQLCRFGEDICVPLLVVWKKNAGEKLKVQLIGWGVKLFIKKIRFTDKII